ncbi:chemotaxis protein, partial [Paracidovorax cattleyae]
MMDGWMQFLAGCVLGGGCVAAAAAWLAARNRSALEQ